MSSRRAGVDLCYGRPRAVADPARSCVPRPGARRNRLALWPGGGPLIVTLAQTRVAADKKTAWAMVVSQCARKGGLYNYYRQDEAGRGFILIAPFESKPVKPE